MCVVSFAFNISRFEPFDEVQGIVLHRRPQITICQEGRRAKTMRCLNTQAVIRCRISNEIDGIVKTGVRVYHCLQLVRLVGCVNHLHELGSRHQSSAVAARELVTTWRNRDQQAEQVEIFELAIVVVGNH